MGANFSGLLDGLQTGVGLANQYQRFQQTGADNDWLKTLRDRKRGEFSDTDAIKKAGMDAAQNYQGLDLSMPVATEYKPSVGGPIAANQLDSVTPIPGVPAPAMDANQAPTVPVAVAPQVGQPAPGMAKGDYLTDAMSRMSGGLTVGRRRNVPLLSSDLVRIQGGVDPYTMAMQPVDGYGRT